MRLPLSPAVNAQTAFQGLRVLSDIKKVVLYSNIVKILDVQIAGNSFEHRGCLTFALIVLKEFAQFITKSGSLDLFLHDLYAGKMVP